MQSHKQNGPQKGFPKGAQKGPQKGRIGLYFLLGTGLCLFGVILKGVATWATEVYVYQLPLIGGLFTSLEISEVTTVILFALLGLSLGALTYYWPVDGLNWPKFMLLLLALPLILGTGYAVRHKIWVRQVALRANVSWVQAEEVTDAFLRQATGQTGGWGFYRYTAKVSQPPTQLDNLEAWSNEEIISLEDQLAQFSGLPVNLFSFLFNAIGWIIRIIYLFLSGLMGLAYFFKGQNWASQQRR